MEFTDEQIRHLKVAFHGNVQWCDEAGIRYFLIPAVTLYEWCTPQTVDLLYCPTARDGYSSRLLFSEKVTTRQNLNWNTTTVILGRTWYAFSWKIDEGQSPASSILTYLRALK